MIDTKKATGAFFFYKYGITLMPVWISDHMFIKVWYKITYPFPNFNGYTVEVSEWISTYISYFMMDVITVLTHARIKAK